MNRNELREQIQDLAKLYHMVLVKRDAATSSTSRASIQADVLAKIYLERLESTIDKLLPDVKAKAGKV